MTCYDYFMMQSLDKISKGRYSVNKDDYFMTEGGVGMPHALHFQISDIVYWWCRVLCYLAVPAKKYFICCFTCRYFSRRLARSLFVNKCARVRREALVLLLLGWLEEEDEEGQRC